MVVRYKSTDLTSDRRAPRRHNKPANSGDCVDFVDSTDEFVHRTRFPFIRDLLTTCKVYHYFPTSVKGGIFYHTEYEILNLATSQGCISRSTTPAITAATIAITAIAITTFAAITAITSLAQMTAVAILAQLPTIARLNQMTAIAMLAEATIRTL